VSFLADAGTEYEIAVDGFDGESGTVGLAWSRTAVAPENLTPPIVSGTPTDGGTLSATPGTWSGTPPIAYTFEWTHCDAATGLSCYTVPGATAQTYALSSADVGYRMRVFVTATNAAGSTYWNSAATDIVAGVLPSNAFPPTIDGTPVRTSSLIKVRGVVARRSRTPFSGKSAI
jgi:hypothetical protein